VNTLERFIPRKKASVGLPAGTLSPIAKTENGKTNLNLLTYDSSGAIKDIQETDIHQIIIRIEHKTNQVSWLNIDSLHEIEVIEAVGKAFGLHPLVLEDILNLTQRPKFEIFEDYLFVVIRIIYWDDSIDEVREEQLSIILMSDLVISFQEAESKIFEPIKRRINEGKGRITSLGADYLAYALIDIVVDNYFVVLEQLGEQIEDLDEKIVTVPDSSTMHEIHKYKRELIYLRKSIWPLRELLSGLARGETKLIEQETIPYIRDIYDHTIQIIDINESFRDVVAGMFDTYLSSISNQMNQVMKVLTIISTIFIPPTLIAGIYGMNFQNMPELQFWWGYFAVLGIIFIMMIVMLFFFKRKKWL